MTTRKLTRASHCSPAERNAYALDEATRQHILAGSPRAQAVARARVVMDRKEELIDDQPEQASMATSFESSFDLQRAQRLLSEAIDTMGPAAPPQAFLDVAREWSDPPLQIDPMDYRRGQYFGTVISVEGGRCLVLYRTAGALILELEDIAPGQVLPRPSDEVRIDCRHGLVNVLVRISSGNKRRDLREGSRPPVQQS
jgi:hypothetical protein